jgi:hypothetical protein
MVKERKVRDNFHTCFQSIEEKHKQGRGKDVPALNFHAMKMYG